MRMKNQTRKRKHKQPGAPNAHAFSNQLAVEFYSAIIISIADVIEANAALAEMSATCHLWRGVRPVSGPVAAHFVSD